jgi:hypothetical protein
MKAALSVTRQDITANHSVFTRSDGEVFELVWNKDAESSLFHKDRPPPGGINLDVDISE